MEDLPTKHKHREADFGLEFRNKFESIKHLFENAQFEHKQTEGNKFYLRELKPKQRKTDKGLIRLSIATTGSADYMYITDLPLYIVIKFKKYAYIIPIDNIDFNKKFLLEEECWCIAIAKI